MCTLAEHGGTTQELYTPNVIWMALLILKGGQTGIVHIERSMILFVIGEVLATPLLICFLTNSIIWLKFIRNYKL